MNRIIEDVQPLNGADQGGGHPLNSLATERLAGWEVVRNSEGWHTLRRPSALASKEDYLAVHGQWPGPVKLVRNLNRIEQQIEVFLEDGLAETADFDSSEQVSLRFNEIVRPFLDVGLSNEIGQKALEWEPPSAKVLAGWLAEMGQESAIDQENNLRLTLKRRGCDGQVRVERGSGRLRFVLPLGRWGKLEATPAAAMRRMAEAANARDRLVRIAWLVTGTTQHCEAQVDLTGLGAGLVQDHCSEPVLRPMVRLAISALELVLRQLGLELSLLAEPCHREVAELLVAQCPDLEGV